MAKTVFVGKLYAFMSSIMTWKNIDVRVCDTFDDLRVETTHVDFDAENEADVELFTEAIVDSENNDGKMVSLFEAICDIIDYIVNENPKAEATNVTAIVVNMLQLLGFEVVFEDNFDKIN